MIRRHILNCILLSSYYVLLLLGLWPAPLNLRTHQFRTTRFYNYYSAALHLLYVALIAIAAFSAYTQQYMPKDSILRWTYSITGMAKMLAALLLLKEAWQQRHAWLNNCAEYWQQVKRYEKLEPELRAADVDVDGLRRQERCLILKFLCGLTVTAFSFTSFWKLQRIATIGSLIMICMNLFVSLLLLFAMNSFYYVILLLGRQFVLMRRGLLQLQRQMQHLTEHAEEHSSSRHVLHLAARLHVLAAFHFACYRLTQRVFDSCQIASAAIMLRLFLTNVRIVHQVVWFILHRRQSIDVWATNSNFLLMIVFYCDALLLVAAIERVLNSCNDVGPLMRVYSDLPLREQQHLPLIRALEQFAVHLKCHKLTYRICGLFEVNKEASLRYFLIVLLQVAVLVQFDLKFQRN